MQKISVQTRTRLWALIRENESYGIPVSCRGLAEQMHTDSNFIGKLVRFLALFGYLEKDPVSRRYKIAKNEDLSGEILIAAMEPSLEARKPVIAKEFQPKLIREKDPIPSERRSKMSLAVWTLGNGKRKWAENNREFVKDLTHYHCKVCGRDTVARKLSSPTLANWVVSDEQVLCPACAKARKT